MIPRWPHALFLLRPRRRETPNLGHGFRRRTPTRAHAKRDVSVLARGHAEWPDRVRREKARRLSNNGGGGRVRRSPGKRNAAGLSKPGGGASERSAGMHGQRIGLGRAVGF